MVNIKHWDIYTILICKNIPFSILKIIPLSNIILYSSLFSFFDEWKGRNHMEKTPVTFQQLCETIELLSASCDSYPYVYDYLQDYFYISPNAAKRFAMTSHSFHEANTQFRSFIHPDDYNDFYKDLNNTISDLQDSYDMQYRMMNKDGESVWINTRGKKVITEDGYTYIVGCFNEIGTRQKADNISGLLGESSLKNYLEGFIPFLPTGYLLRLGIDDFKGINERLGIEYGDLILKKTAECISKCLQPGQELYRLVADEFMVIDFSGDDLEHAVSLYKSIRSNIDRFVEENQYEAVFTISGGILESDNLEDFSFADVMKLSEYALNEAKRRGKNQCYTFISNDYKYFLRRRHLSQLLRQAVRNNYAGFEAYFQPLFHADTHTLYGAETLMRYHTEEYGSVSPGEFIPLLEETGLIIPMGRWILHQALFACRHIQRWIPNFQITVNVSYIQIMKSNIINDIVSASAQYNIPPTQVTVELTESGILESDIHFSKIWEKLKANGIRLALDDFGTGYSNFHYLNDLQPDIIKIDRSFTAKAAESDYEYNLLSLMSNLVHNLNSKICIEGIETEAERDRLQALNPDYSQGFYYGHPCPLYDFIEQFVEQTPMYT